MIWNGWLGVHVCSQQCAFLKRAKNCNLRLMLLPYQKQRCLLECFHASAIFTILYIYTYISAYTSWLLWKVLAMQDSNHSIVWPWTWCAVPFFAILTMQLNANQQSLSYMIQIISFVILVSLISLTIANLVWVLLSQLSNHWAMFVHVEGIKKCRKTTYHDLSIHNTA